MADTSQYGDSTPEFNSPKVETWQQLGCVAQRLIPRSVKMNIVFGADDFLTAVDQYEKYLWCDGIDEEVAIDGEVRASMPHRCCSEDKSDSGLIFTLLSFGQYEADIETLALAASYEIADTPHKILCAAEDLNAIAKHFFRLEAAE